jgi:hypothetical protein
MSSTQFRVCVCFGPEIGRFPIYDGSDLNTSVWLATTSEATLLPVLTSKEQNQNQRESV